MLLTLLCLMISEIAYGNWLTPEPTGLYFSAAARDIVYLA